ncbi:MAG: rRNA maturation RNase YbeY [Acidocella sp. 20-57-95]|nr:MAG: rRNA maturation RNase YbeY [Acidocella sp. 20-57-95]OYV58268.1 MAG: rRNA maturation RNase YbeY [Acidocella sp. 21-58-7]HQT63701.1 rRNA maturation RNase YbeY [Acidocella sp.]HQU04160.1 rRNA maturation RNase YbeY [Acidocella sp.]
MEPRSRYAPYFGGEIIITDRLWHVYVRDVATLVCRAMAVVDCDANVVLTDDRTIQKLNARDRGKNKPTNVLTYEQPPEILLGFGTVLREAQLAGKSVGAHLSHLLIHGALHLEGYDHDHAGAAKQMEAEETWLLARLHIANPWKKR